MDSQGKTSLILIEDYMSFHDEKNRCTLTVLEVWDRLKRSSWSKTHIEHTSLPYYRRNNFKMEYHDTRDKGSIFHFDNIYRQKVEWAWSRGGDVSHFLWWWNVSLEEMILDPEGM